MSYDPTELSEYLASQTLLYLFTGPDFEYKWTDAPTNQIAVIDSVSHTFKHPEGGIEHTTPTLSPDSNRTGLEVKVSRFNPIIRRHRAYPPPGDTALTVYRQNEISGAVDQVWSGIVVETPIEQVSENEVQGVIRCEHLLSVLMSGEGLTETFSPTCPFFVYHLPCPVPQSAFTDNGTVVSVDAENFEVTVSGLAQPADWYKGGVLVAPNGDMRTINSDTVVSTNHVFVLLQNFPGTTLKATDIVSVIAGCDRTRSMCQTKFGAYTGDGDACGCNELQANHNIHAIGRLQQ